MQIIQSIREKGAAVVITVIALSLIGFILMDAQQGGSALFSSFSTKVGKINGESIDINEFNRRSNEMALMQEQRNGQKPQANQLREQTWNQIVSERLFFSEAEKLGITLTSKELSHILLSNDQQNPLFQDQSLRDSVDNTKLNMRKAQEALSNIKKSKGEQRDLINAQVIEPLKLNTSVTKYSGMLNASVYYPTWMQERDAAENNNFATISYVQVPYTEIVDSTIKVTDEEINAYVQKNKGLFKQEAGRSISYVSFSQKANGADSIRTRDAVGQLRPLFESDSNAKAFVTRNASSKEFKDEFEPKAKINAAVADTITKLSPGAVYGPYNDQNSYVLAKMISTSELPDSVKARHILISEKDPNTQQPIRSDADAKKLADSLYAAILAGSDFTNLVNIYSADAGSKTKGGDLGFFGYGTMVPEFNEFCFTKPAGSKGVVKTQFGYHIIDVQSQKDFKTGYKIAYMAKEIEASPETINKASLDATKATAEKTRANLEKYVAKNNLAIQPLPNVIKENDFTVGAFQDARGLVRWAFEADKGDISEPFNLNDQFVVAILDKIYSEGVQDATTARSGSESMIRNQKKAEIIIKKIGNNPTLESAAAAYNKNVQIAGADSTLTFGATMINGIGMEYRVIGAAFNKAYQAKVSPAIQGTTGVFVIKTNSILPKNAETPEASEQRISGKKSTLRNGISSWFEALRKQATIKDNRSQHF